MSDHALTRYLSASTGDTDPSATQEWGDAFLALVASEGPERARFILDQLAILARDARVGWSPELWSRRTSTRCGGEAAGIRSSGVRATTHRIYRTRGAPWALGKVPFMTGRFWPI